MAIKFFIYIMTLIPSECYEIKKVQDLENYLKRELRGKDSYDEQLKTNLAFIFYLKTGEVILLPSDRLGSSLGILFKTRECYQDCVVNDTFPINNPNMPIYEKCQDDVLDISNKIERIISHLDSIINSDSQSPITSPNAISELLIKLKALQPQFSLRDKFYCCLSLGEYVKIVTHGRWILLKYYGKYNPYYTPAILYPNGTILDIVNFFEIFWVDKKLTPASYMLIPYIKNPSLRLEHLRYRRYPNPYFIPE